MIFISPGNDEDFDSFLDVFLPLIPLFCSPALARPANRLSDGEDAWPRSSTSASSGKGSLHGLSLPDHGYWLIINLNRDYNLLIIISIITKKKFAQHLTQSLSSNKHTTDFILLFFFMKRYVFIFFC